MVKTSGFPRRDQDLTIRMTLLAAKMNEKDITQQFTIPNPFYREEFPVWTPETVPATKTVDGMTVQLANLGYGWKYFNPSFLQQVGEDRWERCDSFMHIEDATGNQGESLSPFEPAWKIMADIFPVSSSHFPVEQVRRGSRDYTKCNNFRHGNRAGSESLFAVSELIMIR